MGVVSSSINLNDGVSGVLMNMNRAMNLFTSGLTDAKKAIGANINTAMFDNAITASKNAVAQMALLERQAQETKAATEKAAAPKVFQWQNTGQTRIFQNTGMKRLEQETQGVTAKLNQLSSMQRKIKAQAAATDILPPQASTELERAQNRLSVLMHSMSSLKNQDMSILSTSQVNAMNSSFEQMRQKQFDLTRTMSSMQNNFKLGNVAGVTYSHHLR